MSKMPRDPIIVPNALPCPFCGSAVEMQPWHGGLAGKWLVSCADQADDCHVSPMVCGPTRKVAIQRWNTRRSP